MKRGFLVALVLLLPAAACVQTSSAGSVAPSDAGPEAAASAAACVDGRGATGAGRACPIKIGGPDVGPTIAYPLADRPDGDPCHTGDTCSLPIDPCEKWQGHLGNETVDDDGCACLDGKWACATCINGGSICAEGPGSLPLDASADGASDGAID